MSDPQVPNAERREEIERLWQCLLDKDDRTSPVEYPDMALITFEEFAEFAAALDAQSAERTRAAVPALIATARERDALREALEAAEVFISDEADHRHDATTTHYLAATFILNKVRVALVKREPDDDHPGRHQTPKR